MDGSIEALYSWLRYRQMKPKLTLLKFPKRIINLASASDTNNKDRVRPSVGARKLAGAEADRYPIVFCYLQSN